VTVYTPGDKQREIIDAEDEVLVVLGGAGTGKTTTAAAAARAHLQRRDQDRADDGPWPRAVSTQARDRVLFLSFSRASVARITERSRSILGPYRDRVEITTFHALAWRMITRFGSVIDLPEPYLMSRAQSMLFSVPGTLQYKDLVPSALRTLVVPAVRSHVQARWSLIICDEFQDTNDSQYDLLERIRGDARLLLLGDPDQCIYAGLPDSVGVSPKRLVNALGLPGARDIVLPDASFRDPSGVIPAAAAAIRRREFEGPAVATAISFGRLDVFYDVDPDHEAGTVATTVEALREQGMSVAVFSHHNDALAALSDQLVDAGVDHDITGLSESLTSALDAQMAMAQYAAGIHDWNVVLQYLAIFVTSAIRGKNVPALAYQILGRQAGAATLQQRLSQLQIRLGGLDPEAAFAVAADVHATIGLPSKASAWTRAGVMLKPMLATSARAQRGHTRSAKHVLAHLDQLIADRRAAMLTEDTTETEAVVQLMNLHQTKGREADATVIVLRGNDFFGFENDEPFEEGSRLLYVVFSRARRRIVVLIFGTNLKSLVAPLAALAE